MRFATVLALVWTAHHVGAAPTLFDMGTSSSAVWEGFERVTSAEVWAGGSRGFGWESNEGLRGQARAHTTPVPNPSRGDDEPPPIWTNAITEDSIMGDKENAFIFAAPAGECEVYVVCGSSDAMRSQCFDFDVQVGERQQRVRFEGGYQFRSLRFRARAGTGPLRVRFIPRSKFVVNAILCWSPADAPRVEKELIAPFEEWTYRMPPAEWAKWKLEPEPESGPMPAVGESDRKRGFLIYGRHYLECVYPQNRPRPEELDPDLRLFATPGEYEPVSFTVYALRDLAGAKVSVSNIGPVPAKNIDVRHVRFMRARPNYTVRDRYRFVPDLLERFDTMDLKWGENARFWLTVHVPEDAGPGIHRGKVTFECDGGKQELPITLRVLPFKLREDAAKIFGIYYRHPYDQLAGAEDDVSRDYFRRRAELEHADMARHGTQNVVLSCGGGPADAHGNFRFGFDLLDEKIALGRTHGFVGPIVMGINTGGVYFKYMKERFGSHLRGVKDPPPEFAAEMMAMVRAIEAERRRRGWPEFLYYPIDEPGTEAVSVRFMVTVLKACKDAGVRTYVTADPTHEQFEPMRPFVDVWCMQPYALDPEFIAAEAKSRGVEYWCYPNHVNGENDHTPVAGARMTYGFGFWRSGYRTLIPWIYSYSNGDPMNYLDGPMMDFFNRHEPDGTPVPAAMWEAYREGHDDYRYIYTLEQMIREAREGGTDTARRIAAEAERELKKVQDAIRVQEKYKHDGLWSPGEFDVYRWIVAEQILRMREAQ